MFSSKTVFAAALIAFSCFSFAHSLKCHVCDSFTSCNRSVPIECNQKIANNSRNYLSSFYTGADFTATSDKYNCFSDYLTMDFGYNYYKSCIYQNLQACDSQLSSEILLQHPSRSCYQCSNFDGCNPAGLVNINVATVTATVIFVLIARLMWC